MISLHCHSIVCLMYANLNSMIKRSFHHAVACESKQLRLSSKTQQLARKDEQKVMKRVVQSWVFLHK